jgi:23S rRNA (adenine2503-C2)-methyltransferase
VLRHDDSDLLALSFEATASLLGSRTRALAARKWLYGARPTPARLPERIPGVTPRAWSALTASARLPAWRLVARQVAGDGTVKYALGLADTIVETVLIPGPRRSTVCVSSQAGCSRRCAFCATASLGLRRQLSAGEILIQYLVASAEAEPTRPARNVVFMGMGEPMDNLDAVLVAVERLIENPVPGLAEEHVTVSTSGILPGLTRFLAEGRGQLALSLSATTNAQREALVPHAQRWPLEALLGALKEDPRARPGRRHLIAYVLWDGVNDSDEDARRLASLLAGLPVHVNLIPHNVVADSAFRPPAPGRIERFHAIVSASGIRCIVRQPRGPDISAACGQLALVRGSGVGRLTAASGNR